MTQELLGGMLSPMFGMGSLVVVTLVVLLGAVAAAVAVMVSTGPLKPSTVDRFARRQQVQLTDSNATHVMAALLVTHRWRRAGLVLGLALGVLWSLSNGALTLYLLAGLLGWFAGAVVAEWRIGTLAAPGERRAATLERRTVTRYLTVEVLLVAASAAVVLVALLLAAWSRTGASTAWWGWVAYSCALGVVFTLTARAVVGRPSGFIDADVRDADDALRTHALGVLVGSAIAASYPAIAGFAVLATYPDGVPYSMDPAWTFLILVAALLIGEWVAAWAPSARRRRPATHPSTAAGGPRAGDRDLSGPAPS